MHSAGFRPLSASTLSKPRALARGASNGLVIRSRSGYTIFELIMVVVLVGIIFSVTAPLMIEVGRGWQLASNRNKMSEGAMVALDRIAREIRQIRDTTSVLTATGSVFQFIDVNNNNITFSRSGNYLMRNSDQLAANVTALTFTYYDGAPILTPTVNPLVTNIKSIVINLTFSLGGTSLNLESTVFPRRLQ